MEVDCPFKDLRSSASRGNCVYSIEYLCEDIECCPGNGDAWCREKIEHALNNDLSSLEEIS